MDNVTVGLSSYTILIDELHTVVVTGYKLTRGVNYETTAEGISRNHHGVYFIWLVLKRFVLPIPQL